MFTLSDQASVEEIRQKEKEYLERRELIETSLESFTRSATSILFTKLIKDIYQRMQT